MSELLHRGSSVSTVTLLQRGSSISSSTRYNRLLHRGSSIAITTPRSRPLHRGSSVSIAAILHRGSSIAITTSLTSSCTRLPLQRTEIRLTRSAGCGLLNVAHFVLALIQNLPPGSPGTFRSLDVARSRRPWSSRPESSGWILAAPRNGQRDEDPSPAIGQRPSAKRTPRACATRTSIWRRLRLSARS